jgi:hypothetical protein
VVAVVVTMKHPSVLLEQAVNSFASVELVAVVESICVPSEPVMMTTMLTTMMTMMTSPYTRPTRKMRRSRHLSNNYSNNQASLFVVQVEGNSCVHRVEKFYARKFC